MKNLARYIRKLDISTWPTMYSFIFTLVNDENWHLETLQGKTYLINDSEYLVGC